MYMYTIKIKNSGVAIATVCHHMDPPLIIRYLTSLMIEKYVVTYCSDTLTITVSNLKEYRV
jgi:hypothetical protein